MRTADKMFNHFSLICVILLTPICSGSGVEKTRVKLVEGQSLREGKVRLFTGGVWVTVCNGNEGFADAACQWSGYREGVKVTPSPRTLGGTNNNRWKLDVMCPKGARNLNTCMVERCKGSEDIYVKCSGYPDCTLDDGESIPGNNTVIVGTNKVCFCGRNGAVTCNCRNIALKCQDGSRAELDGECNPMCNKDSADCKDIQVASLCQYFRSSEQCSKKQVRDICRKTCGICQSSSETGCEDLYDEQICGPWKENGSCQKERVQKVCKKTCEKCPGTIPVPIINSYNCTDQYKTETCSIWRKAGHCKTSETVQNWCKLTCELCGDKPAPQPALKSTTNCKDSLTKSRCELSKQRGSCSINMYILKSCAETCGLCAPLTKDNCYDIYKADTCYIWRSNGDCQNQTIQRYCPMSCGVCEAITGEKTKEVGNTACFDNAPGSLCEYYKSSGYCEMPKYRGTMKTQCPMSCGMCRATLCTDKISRATCKRWKKWGSCETNSSIRDNICALTCGTC